MHHLTIQQKVAVSEQSHVVRTNQQLIHWFNSFGYLVQATLLLLLQMPATIQVTIQVQHRGPTSCIVSYTLTNLQVQLHLNFCSSPQRYQLPQHGCSPYLRSSDPLLHGHSWVIKLLEKFIASLHFLGPLQAPHLPSFHPPRGFFSTSPRAA